MIDEAARKLLSPAPRDLPFLLRLQLLANRTTTIGGFVLGLGLAVGMIAILSARPVDSFRLATDAREAGGGLVAVEPTHYTENDHPVYRCHYAYQTPDGIERRGHCFTLGKTFANPPAAAEGDPTQRPPVTVEYCPAHPEVSRIKGQRLAPLAIGFSLVLLLPALAGLAITGFGLANGARRTHLLANGELAQGTLVSAAAAAHEEGEHKQIPFAEFRERSLAGPSGIAAGLEVLPETAKALVGGFLKAWTCGVVVIFGFGLLTLATALVVLLARPGGALQFNGRPAERLTMVLFFAGFLVAWVIVGSLFLAVGRKASSRATTGHAVAAAPSIRCTFEFRPAHGEIVRSSDTVTFSERLGAAGTEPVLYDPGRPDRALLLYGIADSVSVSDFGDWLPTEVIAPWLRAAIILACLAGFPFLGWTLWHQS